MQSTARRSHVPQCHEYCEGNLAQYYCPECTAMFCDSCYNIEHCGNERKSQHGKLTELRSVCTVHKHTLDYFNLTSLQPMCVICKKDIIQRPEYAHHVIDSIEAMVPRLRSLVRKKLDTARALIDRLNQEVNSVELSAKSTMDSAVSYVGCCFATLRNYLDERESELVTSAQKSFEKFLEDSDEREEVKNTVTTLQAVVEEGEVLLKKEIRSLVVEFPTLFTRLKELCNVASSEKQLKRMKIMIEFERSVAEQLRQVGTVTLSSCSSQQTELKTESVETTEDLLPMNCDTERTPCEQEKGKKRPLAKSTASECAKHAKTSKATTPEKTVANRLRQQASMSPQSPPREICRDVGGSQSCTSANQNASSESPSRADTCKRVRRGGELSKEINKCDIILTELWAQDESCPFARPVDRKQYPGYYDVIKQPIDLSVIKEKLHSLQYASAVDFVRDVRLMFNNCRTYNEKGSRVLVDGEKLEEMFNRLLRKNFPNFQDVFLEGCEDDGDN